MITQFITLFAAPHCRPPTFFGLKPWYAYLPTDANCNVTSFNVLNSNGSSSFQLIALAIVDDMLRIGGLVAIGFIIYGGVLYLTSQGSADQTQKAQNTIQNALIGLVICLLAVAVVSFLGRRIA